MITGMYSWIAFQMVIGLVTSFFILWFGLVLIAFGVLSLVNFICYQHQLKKMSKQDKEENFDNLLVDDFYGINTKEQGKIHEILDYHDINANPRKIVEILRVTIDVKYYEDKQKKVKK